MTSPESMRKLADAVEALREVEGIEIDASEVAEVPQVQDPRQLMQQMMGMPAGQPETKEQLVITADIVDGDRPEYPEEPSAKDLAEESDFESEGQDSGKK